MGFRFKHFNVDDSRSAMKVGTDAMLLGAWMPLPAHCRSVLDIGAGSGVLSLMAAQRLPEAQITALEIDSGAYADMRENFAASPWAHRLKAVLCDACTFQSEAGFDLIISNPPYFPDHTVSPDAKRATARTALSLSPATVLGLAAKLLSDTGLLVMVTPEQAAGEVLKIAEYEKLCIHRQCLAIQRPGHKKSRTLWCFGRKPSQALKAETIFVRNAENTPSDEYIKLTQDFHLFPPK